jgi:hypothetical protein
MHNVNPLMRKERVIQTNMHPTCAVIKTKSEDLFQTESDSEKEHSEHLKFHPL